VKPIGCCESVDVKPIGCCEVYKKLVTLCDRPVTDCCELRQMWLGFLLVSIAANEVRGSGDVTESVEATNEAVNL